MTEWFGMQLILKEQVVPIEPFPEHIQHFFETYEEMLREVYKHKEKGKDQINDKMPTL